jgi:hypothetical protein
MGNTENMTRYQTHTAFRILYSAEMAFSIPFLSESKAEFFHQNGNPSKNPGNFFLFIGLSCAEFINLIAKIA